MKGDSLDANLNVARNESSHGRMSIRPIRTCGGCGGAATVLVNGYYPRCKPCANKVLSIWSEMRANKAGQDS